MKGKGHYIQIQPYKEIRPINNPCEIKPTASPRTPLLRGNYLSLTYLTVNKGGINRVVFIFIVLLLFITLPDPVMSETFIDDLGRRVEISEVPKRIVVLNASNLEMLFAIGANIVGRPEAAGMQEQLYQKVKDLPSVGQTYNPSVEKIVSLRPDLVIGNAVGFHQSLIPALDAAKIRCVLLSIKDFNDIFEKLRFFGRLLRRQQAADRLIDKVKGEVALIKTKVKGKAKKKVLIIWGSPQSFSMALPSSFVGSLFKELGIDNVSELAKAPRDITYAPLSMEYALKADPDAIFIVNMGDPHKMRDKALRELEQNQAWSAFRAVRDNRVYYLPYELFTVNPSIRVAEAMDYIVKVLY